jgi:hypothetical protein
MTQRSCPHCAKPIDVDVRVWEYDDEPHVELVRVHVWEQCTPPDPSGPAPRAPEGWRYIGPWPGGACEPFDRGYRPGGACNWLGPTCNDASHVTPCYVRDWFELLRINTLVADVAADTVATGLARCVHHPKA